jgi:hypothetical protein
MKWDAFVSHYPFEKIEKCGGQSEIYKIDKFIIKKFFDLSVYRCELNCGLKFDHPCILKPFTYCSEKNGYLAFSFGLEIIQALCENKISVEQIMDDILSAILYVHSQGHTHSDIKPENMIFINGRAQLIDFGSADSPNYSVEDDFSKLAISFNKIVEEFRKLLFNNTNENAESRKVLFHNANINVEWFNKQIRCNNPPTFNIIDIIKSTQDDLFPSCKIQIQTIESRVIIC